MDKKQNLQALSEADVICRNHLLLKLRASDWAGVIAAAVDLIEIRAQQLAVQTMPDPAPASSQSSTAPVEGTSQVTESQNSEAK